MLIVTLSGLGQTPAQYASRASAIARMSSQSRQRANYRYNRLSYRPDPPRVRAAPRRQTGPIEPPTPAEMEADRLRREEATKRTSARLRRMFAPTFRPGAGQRAIRRGRPVADYRDRGRTYSEELGRRQAVGRARRRRQQAAHAEWLAQPRQQPGGVTWLAPAEFIAPTQRQIPILLTPSVPGPGLPASLSPGTSTTDRPGITATIVPAVPVPGLSTDPGDRLRIAKERLGIRA